MPNTGAPRSSASDAARLDAAVVVSARSVTNLLRDIRRRREVDEARMKRSSWLPSLRTRTPDSNTAGSARSSSKPTGDGASADSTSAAGPVSITATNAVAAAPTESVAMQELNDALALRMDDSTLKVHAWDAPSGLQTDASRSATAPPASTPASLRLPRPGLL